MSETFNGMGNELDGWTQYQDPQGRFRIQHPTGWTVQSDSQHVLVQSLDHSMLVLAENFSPEPGEMAMSFLMKTAAAHVPLFPKGRIERVVQQTSEPDEAMAAVSYEGAKEPGQARLLCRISQDRGMLFAMAAPGSQFPISQPALTKILQSLKFNSTPTATVSSPSGVIPSQACGVETAAQTNQEQTPTAVTSPSLSPAPDVHYVRWSDPMERSFHVEVPEGWKVEGGAFRFGPTDIRQSIQVTAPADDMAVLIGHPQLSNFTLPNPMMMQMGVREGQPLSQGTFQSMLYHYMPALEFNRWFIHTHLAPGLDNLTVQKEEDQPELSRQQSEAATQNLGGMAQVTANCGMTEFGGHNKRTGKQITGVLRSTTYHYPPNPMGGIWYATPTCSFFNNDAASENNRATAEAVLGHILSHWQVDPEWQQRTQQEQIQITNQMNRMAADTGRQMIEGAAARSRIQAQANEDRRARTMQSYWSRTAAHDNMQRQQVNHIGDRTDVFDPTTGQAWNVPSGSTHYYAHPDSNTIVGTDSAYEPGVDFTKMSEF